MGFHPRQRAASRLLAGLALCGSFLIGTLPGAASAAATGATRAGHADQVRERADFLMARTYREFPAYARQHEKPFDWTTDGCTHPTPRSWAKVFHDACVIHDFGYRNYGGGGLRLDPTEARRKSVDDRFLEEMLRICRDRPDALTNCPGAARTMHQAVRQYGGAAFYVE
ncbi:phospholipase A2 [Streptomyces sp. UNOB3_S3]|uniref:phospholipase A2 n=1 Tax=Streptomyces sp. UNOB3_S3 TaxID=2871682 RepID=UPI001E3E037B|nr:phospholipase A2 [Streptomyces sp. UNOB3_S3]MCC3776808.1 phospholipase [Streptomyces sp. UNOB3_S3]